MRLLVTADLHYNHARSKPLAEQLIDEMNQVPMDVLLVIGDTAAADGDALERCLSRFTFDGPKLFVAGNHELWTLVADSYELFTSILPARVRALGWHWLEREPFIFGDIGIVGSVGWYDYSFAVNELGIPRRFYEQKISPGAAARFTEFDTLFIPDDDIPASAHEIHARWNDGKFVKLHRSDDVFLRERMDLLGSQLDVLRKLRKIVAAIHHVPLTELLPPKRGGQWAFARAFLGSAAIGELLLGHSSVSHILCGHSHWPAEAMIGPVQAINIGSGYRSKTFRVLDIG